MFLVKYLKIVFMCMVIVQIYIIYNFNLAYLQYIIVAILSCKHKKSSATFVVDDFFCELNRTRINYIFSFNFYIF